MVASRNRSKSGETAESRREEAVRLYEWCRVVMETLAESDPIKKAYRSDWTRRLEGALRDERVSGLREAAKVLLASVQGLAPGERARVDQALRAKLGTGLAEEMRATADEVKAIVERGIIDDDDEFRLLRSWEEIIGADPGKESEVAAIRRLMERFVTGRE